MYWIVTDSAIDMPRAWVDRQQNFRIVNLTYLMDGNVLVDDGDDEKTRQMYDSLRAGKMVTTSQVTPATWAETFRDLMGAGNDVLVIAFSGGLSGTCSAAMAAAKDVAEEYPQQKIEVIDSLCASGGEGLLVEYALKNRDGGMSFEDNCAWVKENIPHLIHWFTVNDLMHLYRGGRVSAASAYVGSLVRIKPIMNVSPEGKLALREKAAGRKRSIRILAEKVRQDIVNPEGQTIRITHGDCADEAESLAAILRSELTDVTVELSYVGPVIGAHTGPGVIAVFCMGGERAVGKSK